MSSSDSQIDKPQRGRLERAELPDVNIDTGAQSIPTERRDIRELHIIAFFLHVPAHQSVLGYLS